MKKNISLLAVMIISVLCSACVNNLAVMQLNQKAKEYNEEGNYKAAIARLESSIDLDGNVYETRYNLAAAYMDIKECQKALEQINIADTLIKNEPSVYYIQGIANSCLADEIAYIKDDSGAKVRNDAKLSDPVEVQKYLKYLNDANAAYKKYIDLAPATEQTNQIVSIIGENQDLIERYSVDQ